MGINGLTKLIYDYSPEAIQHGKDLENYTGKKIAMDASIYLYKDLAYTGQRLLDSTAGECAFLIGTFNTNIRLLQTGVIPVYVFDGRPPEMKSRVLKDRAENQEVAKAHMEFAKRQNDWETFKKYRRKTVKLNKQHVDECKKLLGLMGIPYFEAPEEAEAQCAELARAGKVYATATEDMDALTFGNDLVLRHFTTPYVRKKPIQEFNLKKVLVNLQINLEEFVDLSILLGCDYCESIKGIRPSQAVTLIQQMHNIESVLNHPYVCSLQIPENWRYKEARQMFLMPNVVNCEKEDFALQPLDKNGVLDYLCGEKKLDEDIVREGIRNLLI